LIPSGSDWWDLVQAGAQQAAKQARIPIQVNRVSVSSSQSQANLFDEPVIYLRRQGAHGSFSFRRPNDWQNSLGTKSEFRLELKTDVSWIAKQIIELVQASGEKPSRIFVWCPDESADMATTFAETLSLHLPSL
jgi:hypothetical protein